MYVLNSAKCPKCNSENIEISEYRIEYTKVFYSMFKNDNGTVDLERDDTDYIDAESEDYNLFCKDCNLDYKIELGENFILN